MERKLDPSNSYNTDYEIDEHLFRLFFKTIPTNVFFKDTDGRYRLASDSCIQDNFILCKTSIFGKNELDLYNDTLRHEEEMKIISTKKGVRYQQYLEFQGEPVYLDIKKEPVIDQNDKVLGIVGVVHNITSIKLLEDKMRKQSITDALTGLYNRTYFQQRCEQILTNENLPLSIIIGDSNSLKYMNDNFGHVIGDTLLVDTAYILKIAAEADDEVFRIGGDEFVMLCPRTNSESCKEKLYKIRDMERQNHLTLVPINTSYGYATIYSVEESLSDGIIKAESMMYWEKRSLKKSDKQYTN